MVMSFLAHLLLLSIEVPNETTVVLNAIGAFLDAYFAVRLTPLTEDRIMDIQSKLLKCSRTFTDLYQLNARIGGIEDPDIPHSRKLHAAVCVIKPFLKHFGTFDKADTTSHESIHRVMTVTLCGIRRVSDTRVCIQKCLGRQFFLIILT